jgi:hypothetical protein
MHSVAEQLGMRALHCNQPSSCYGVNKMRLAHDMKAADSDDASPAISELALGRYAQPRNRSSLGGFQAFGDLPWYHSSRRALDAMASSAGSRPIYVVTNRSYANWHASVEQMLRTEMARGRCRAVAKGWDLGNPHLFEYARTLLEAAGDSLALRLLCSPPQRLRNKSSRRADVNDDYEDDHDDDGSAPESAPIKLLTQRLYQLHAKRVATEFSSALFLHLPSPDAADAAELGMRNLRRMAVALGLPQPWPSSCNMTLNHLVSMTHPINAKRSSNGSRHVDSFGRKPAICHTGNVLQDARRQQGAMRGMMRGAAPPTAARAV